LKKLISKKVSVNSKKITSNLNLLVPQKKVRLPPSLWFEALKPKLLFE